jgi:hypothetical protein
VDYRDADEEYFELFEKHGDALFAVVGRTKFPKTYAALFGFVIKTNSLKTAMFDMVDSNNPYAFKALFRCLCDHYIKFLYLFMRFLEENTDAVGDEFFNLCGASEMMEYLDSIRLSQALIGNEIVLEAEKAIHEMYPRAAGMSKRQLSEASAKFKYRAILRFLNDIAPGIISKERPFLATIVPSYALLSSFVHGGPWSDRDIYTYAGEEALDDCDRQAGFVFAMTASVFMFSVMAVSREHSEFLPLSGKVRTIMRKYLSSDSPGEA